MPQCPIAERLVNSLMMHGRNNGKKMMAVTIVKHAFEIVHLLTGEVRLFKVIVNLLCTICCIPFRTQFKSWWMLFRTVAHVRTPLGLVEQVLFVVRQWMFLP